MTLFQRMHIDDEIGFNYAFMGYAEFENGSTSVARAQLARLMLADNLTARKITIVSRFGKSRELLPAVIVGEKAFVDGIEGDSYIVTSDRTSLRTDDESVVAWMMLSTQPLFIFRDFTESENGDNFDRLEKFLKHFIEINPGQFDGIGGSN